jgi:hypothetical protein
MGLAALRLSGIGKGIFQEGKYANYPAGVVQMFALDELNVVGVEAQRAGEHRLKLENVAEIVEQRRNFAAIGQGHYRPYFGIGMDVLFT